MLGTNTAAQQGHHRAGAAAEAMRDALARRIGVNHVPDEFAGLEEQRKHLYDLLKRTIVDGEGNSVLVVGPRGVGKTMIVKHALRELREKHGSGFDEVRLDFRHTSDRLAVRAIARALCVKVDEELLRDEGEGEDMGGAGEVLGELQDRDDLASANFAFAAALDMVLAALHGGGREKKSVVFVLDEFDQFTKRPKQTLLYNLFDIAQSASVPIAVVGLTCREDICDLFEKRVASRFSHRMIHLHHLLTMDQYTAMAATALTLPPGTDGLAPRTIESHNATVKKALSDPATARALERLHTIDNSVRALYDVLIPVIASLDETTDAAALIGRINTAVSRRYSDNTAMAMAKGLSVLEVCMLIACMQLTEPPHNLETVNFEMAYGLYRDFSMGKNNMVALFAKPVALKAYERLLQLRLLTESSASAKGPRQYRTAKLMLTPETVREAVQRHTGLPSAVVLWSKRAYATTGLTAFAL